MEIIRRDSGFWKELDWTNLAIQHRYGTKGRLRRDTFANAEEMRAQVDYYLALDPPFQPDHP